MALVDIAPWCSDAARTSAERPRLRRVATAGQAACFIARCLSYDNSTSDRAELQELLRGGRVDWPLVARLANCARLTPALDLGLARKALTDLLPGDFRAYLGMIRDLNRRRNRRIAQQSAEVFAALNEAGLRPVLMKGGLSLFEADMDEGVFMMADMDVLLPEEAFPLAHGVLRSLGYVSLGDPPVHVHALTYHRAGELATIDLHRRVGPQTRLLSAADARRAAMAVKAGPLELAGLCPTHRVLVLLMTYCLLEPQHLSGELPLKGLHELAVVCRRHGRSVDWTAIDDVVRRHTLHTPARAWFAMAYHLFRIPIPRALRGGPADRRHMHRCLLQLEHPYLSWPIRYAARLAWAFSALRIDYRYGCGLTGRPLAAARLHHATRILARRCRAHMPAAARTLLQR